MLHPPLYEKKRSQENQEAICSCGDLQRFCFIFILFVRSFFLLFSFIVVYGVSEWSDLESAHLSVCLQRTFPFVWSSLSSFTYLILGSTFMHVYFSSLCPDFSVQYTGCGFYSGSESTGVVQLDLQTMLKKYKRKEERHKRYVE